MSGAQMMWFTLRLLVIGGVAWGISSIPSATSNLDWVACGIISFVTGVGLFLWFVSIRNRDAIDWSDSFSLTKPFFPMNQNPVRFWLLAAVTLVLGGLIAFLKEITDGWQHAAFGATFFFLGLAILLALLATKSIFR